MGLENKGGCQNLHDSRPFSLHFPGGFGFRRKKSPILALDSTNFQKISHAARAGPFYLT